MGGNATLASYGVPDAGWASAAASHDAFAAAFPDAHMAFLDACGLYRRVGGYLFVHAGIRPGVPLEAQTRDDLIWIREPFLTSTADFGFKVVHGHTIVPAVEHHPNRIADRHRGGADERALLPGARGPRRRAARAGSAAEAAAAGVGDRQLAEPLAPPLRRATLLHRRGGRGISGRACRPLGV